MQIISQKRCCIGEGPIWNDNEGLLYFTNGMENEICKLNTHTEELTVIPTEIGVAAIAFDQQNRMIVSRGDGVFYLDQGIAQPLYNPSAYQILHGNDMKVGPDGRIYVGTQSEKRLGISNKVDGKLYSIDSKGHVRILLDGLILSNGMEWSIDEKRFYHTDSGTRTIKEYAFDKRSGSIEFTGRSIGVRGVDGFTIDENDCLYVACWGQGHIAVVDTHDMHIVEYIELIAKKPASCTFVGEEMNELAVVTAGYRSDFNQDKYDGFTFKKKMSVRGRKPYLFG